MNDASAPGALPSRIDWRAELLILALAIAESAILWLIVDLFAATTHDDAGRVSVFPVFFVVYLGTALPRWLDAFDFWDRSYSLVMAFGIVLSAVVVVKSLSYPSYPFFSSAWLNDGLNGLIARPSSADVPVWASIVIVAYAWWRGKSRAEPGPDPAHSMVRNGTIAILFAAAGQASIRAGQSQRETMAAILVFFIAALSSVAFSRMRADTNRLATAMGGHWLGSMLAPVFVIAFGAVVIAGILSRDLLDAILLFFAPLVWGLSVVFRILILTLAVIAFVIVSPILWFLSTHPINFAGIHIQPVQTTPDQVFHDAVERSSHVPDSIRYLVAAFVLLTIFTGITRFVLRRRRRPPANQSEERTSVLSVADVLQLLKALLAQFMSKPPLPPVDSLASLRGDPAWAHTVAIRESYAEFLVWSRDLGFARLDDMTPSEHRQLARSEISRIYQQADVDAIADGYNLARYDAVPAGPRDAETVRTAWARLRQATEPGRR